MDRSTNLDLDLLRTFVLVAEAGGFTRAAERLGRSQPAVSLQIRRLEEQLGTSLFDRGGRDVAPTAAGEALLPKARRLLRVNDEIVSTLRETQVEGEVRFGAPEDVATAFLPRILGDFARARPRVNLVVTCDFTVNLLDQLSRGGLDLALVKREPTSTEFGTGLRRERLVWAAADEELARATVLALIAAPAPDVYRRRAIAALNAYGATYRLAYTSPSLAGQHAALRAGLGVAALPEEMVPKDLVVLGKSDRLPPLEDTEIALVRAKGARGAAVDLLAEEVVRSLGRQSPHMP